MIKDTFIASLQVELGPFPKPAVLFIDGFCLVSSSSDFPDRQMFQPVSWNSKKVMEADETCFLCQEMGDTENFFLYRSSTGFWSLSTARFLPLQPHQGATFSQKQRSSKAVPPNPLDLVGTISQHQYAPTEVLKLEPALHTRVLTKVVTGSYIILQDWFRKTESLTD